MDLRARPTPVGHAEQRGRRTFGVPGRLLCLVLIPLLGAAAAVALLIEDRMGQVEATRQISAEVEVLRGLASLQMAVSSEWPMSNAIKRGQALGVPPAELSRVLDIDLVTRLDE